jgi:hypothetical protein
MALASTDQILQSAHQWLKPLIHVLLTCGITWKEFAGLSKMTYVEVATGNFGKRGRPTNVSRTAVLTGLGRREVRKQRQLMTSAPRPQSGYVTKASLVLSAWHLDQQFLNANGTPARLKLNGQGKRTFAALIEKAGGADVKPSTLLKELVNAGAVRVRTDGRLEALQRNYIPHAMDEQLIRLWGTVVADVARTYVHNLTRPDKATRRFERSAVNDQIPATAAPEFARLLQREGQAFLERIDQWLTEQEHAPSPGGKVAKVRLGVGLYHIQD